MLIDYGLNFWKEIIDRLVIFHNKNRNAPTLNMMLNMLGNANAKQC